MYNETTGMVIPYNERKANETPSSKLWREVYIIFLRTGSHDNAKSRANEAVESFQSSTLLNVVEK